MSTTVSEAVTLLKCLREAVLGAKYTTQYMPKYEEQLAWNTVIADSVSKYVFALDSFLTDSVDLRDLSKDAGEALRVVLLNAQWEFLLSDNETSVAIRLPTHEDHSAIKLTFPDRPANARAYHRWKLIDIPASQPTEFGPPDENGREIRPQ